MDQDRPGLTDGERETIRVLQDGHDFILALPPEERHIAALAASGSPVWEIAQQMRMSEGAVAHTIDSVVAALTGREVEQVETGGLGADTDPGPSGGYDPDPFGGAGRYPTPKNDAENLRPGFTDRAAGSFGVGSDRDLAVPDLDFVDRHRR